MSNGAKNIESLKSERKAAGKHIAVKDLPEEDRFRQLRSEKEHFVDTIKLIAYRVHDEVVASLCEELTATETVFPGTDLRLIRMSEADYIVISQRLQ